MTIEFTSGADIKIGELLYAEMSDQDTNEPITLVYPMIEGKTPIGIAMSYARPWQKIIVAVEGVIGSQATLSGIADQKLRAGDMVYLTPDGTIRKATDKRYRLGIAGADLKKGQDVYFDPEIKAYLPSPDGYPVAGQAERDTPKGSIFYVVIKDE